MLKFRPLLASPVDFDQLDFNNTWLSPKLDGIRAIVIDGVVVSRNLKPIPNEYVQYLFGQPELEGYDGEIIVGEPNSPTVYHDTYSGVMRQDNRPGVTFFVFDHIGEPKEEYHKRLLRLSRVIPDVQLVTQHEVKNMEELLTWEQHYLGLGYEGVMLRAHSGPSSFYKYGRATAKSGTLLKCKRFTDDESTVVGTEEEMANMNEATTDALGHTKRSSHQENKVGKGRLGALVCETKDGVIFRIGSGFTAAQRESLWAERQSLVGRIAKFKHFDIGAKTAPRFPVFLGWRDPIDF